MEKGNINVQSANIFPIIKRFLYSDHEIFLRELVSNAVDATRKLETLANRGEAKGDVGELQIAIAIDKEAGTLTISDRGIGMTEDEVRKYINQIALSSAQDFLDKYENQQQIIGHFGLGFYSAFMVAHKVEIQSLSYQEGASPVHWSCLGEPEYELDAGTRTERGTDIILHIADDSKEFLEEGRIHDMLTKFCAFLPVPVFFGEEEYQVPVEASEGEEGKADNADAESEEPKTETRTRPRQINNTTPAWTRKPADLTDEDYQNFYKELYPMSEPPLFWIHLNVDYPFNLTGILYFPQLNNRFEVQKNKIQLYSNQVFVTDNVEDIVPEWLTLLHGVIDSPDIPLNVSRSYLQGDPEVKKISAHVSKKVASRVEELFKNDRELLEEKWDHLGLFVKYGMISDEKFHDRCKDYVLFEDTEGKKYTKDELRAAIEGNQTNKDGELVILYTGDPEQEYSYIKAAERKDYKVIKLNSPVDPHFVSHAEQKGDKIVFRRVDSESMEAIVSRDDAEVESALTEQESESLKNIFDGIKGEDNVNVELKSLGSADHPVSVVRPEWSRRFTEMNRLSGNESGFGEFRNLVVNKNHPLAGKILAETDEDKRKEMARQLCDLALLEQGQLKGERLASFIDRSLQMISGKQEVPAEASATDEA